MQAYLTLTRRELAGFLFSITGYVIVAAAAFLVACGLLQLISAMGEDPSPVTLVEVFPNTWFFWLIFLMTLPVITMRLFALEKFSGTFETLMTTPVSDWQVVAAKFTAAVVFYVMMWLPLFGSILILHRFAPDAVPLDPGLIGSTFLGIFLFGCTFLSLGCFASALTRSQVIAAMVTLFLGVAMFMMGFLKDWATASGWKSKALSFFDFSGQMQDFVRGILDTRWVVFYVTVTFFFLFLTLRVLESRRWK